MEKTKWVEFHIKRQTHQTEPSHWEKFQIQWRPNLNVIVLLQSTQVTPITLNGMPTSPPAWEAACLEEVCGTCTMVINGKPRQACSTLVDSLTQPIRLEPLSKFPLVRDLIVDRSRMFEHLKQIKAWLPSDGTHALGAGPRHSQTLATVRYKLSECMTCGCCLEACPQYGPHSPFIGPQAIAQIHLFNSYPTPMGSSDAAERLESVMAPGGITDCGDAQNCIQACPKKIPLTESIAQISRATTLHGFKKLLG